MGPLYRRWRISRKSYPFFLVPIWLLAFALMLGSAVQKSATVDEPAHIQRGLAYLLTGATQFRLGHPVTGHALAAVPALLEPNLVLPTDHPSWAAGDWSVAANIFMW